MLAITGGVVVIAKHRKKLYTASIIRRYTVFKNGKFGMSSTQNTIRRVNPFIHNLGVINMKNCLFIIVVILAAGICYSQEIQSVPYNNSYTMDMIGTVSFMPESTIKVILYEPEYLEIFRSFFVEIISGISFINFEIENNKNNKFLILSNENICEIFSDSNSIFESQVFVGISGRHLEGGGDNVWLLPIPDKIFASSYYKEGNILFEPNQERELLQPLWVEGAVGNGINEKLFISAKGCFALHISIGYVSYKKPELYYENSRPSRIRLYVKNIFNIECELEDTPNYQIINLPKPLGADDVLELEILDVYQGTKYMDTCVNEIYYDYIPWKEIDNANLYDYIPWQNWGKISSISSIEEIEDKFIISSKIWLLLLILPLLLIILYLKKHKKILRK